MNRLSRIIVIGVSSGGFEALPILLKDIPAKLEVPVIIVQHRGATLDDFLLVERLKQCCELEVKEAMQLDSIQAGCVYIAPGGYHLLINPDLTFSLNVDDYVCYVRPSIDLLFQSAAKEFGAGAIGVILTGANRDGAEGLAMINRCGGLTIVQTPGTAQAPEMPIAAIEAVPSAMVLPLGDIAISIIAAVETVN